MKVYNSDNSFTEEAREKIVNMLTMLGFTIEINAKYTIRATYEFPYTKYVIYTHITYPNSIESITLGIIEAGRNIGYNAKSEEIKKALGL